MLIDSHCHLNYMSSERYDMDITAIIKLANENGVLSILNVCTRLDEFAEVLTIAKTYSNVYASVGVQPSEIIDEEPTANELLTYAQDSLVVGIGETGLDYHYDSVSKSTQQARFATHIQVALSLNKPLIVHTRQAQTDTMALLKTEGNGQVRAVMHCFTEDWSMARDALDQGYYLSFSGIVTFKNAADLRDVVRKTPLDRILVETDAPYLAPIPYRGKPNQPAYLRDIALFVADLKGVPFEDFAAITTNNFNELFLS